VAILFKNVGTKNAEMGIYVKSISNNMEVLSIGQMQEVMEVTADMRACTSLVDNQQNGNKRQHVEPNVNTPVCVRRSIETHGGTYSGVREMDKTTVLVCASPSGDKYQHSKKWNIPVSPQTGCLMVSTRDTAWAMKAIGWKIGWKMI